jgi:putative acetyltransferase
MTRIRYELPEDAAAVRTVNFEAFGQPDEGAVVDAIRDNCEQIVSLVALDGDRVVGHILFSPATVETPADKIGGMGLAPMSVLPSHQRCGVGSELIKAGIQILREEGYPFVVVLGHPQYYPRFGFSPASQYGIRCEWEVPDEVFMILPLDTDRMRDVHGLARYRPEFAGNVDGP